MGGGARAAPVRCAARARSAHTVWAVSRTPTQLAALASGAVSGLDPVSVRAGRSGVRDRCVTAFVTDSQRRSWVVRVPRTPAVGAAMETATTLVGLVARRLPFSVPAPRGFVAVPEGRGVVYPAIHGRTVVLEAVPPGPGVAAEIGRAIAAVHNLDRGVYDEAGMPAYEPDAWRLRRLADLDRGAATGHVPAALLSRWERALEHVTLWKFAPTPVHGDLNGDRILVTFSDEEDSTTASVRGLVGWDDARVADPADDFAALVAECSPEGYDSIFEAYALALIERPDRHLKHRARLASELALLTRLLEAVSEAEPQLIAHRAAELRELEEVVAHSPDDLVPEPVVRQPVTPAPAAPAAEEVFDAGDLEDEGDEASDTDNAADSEVTDSEDTGVEGAEDTDADDPAEKTGSGNDHGEDDDPSQHTQLLQVGELADETTIIPEEELERLRSERPPKKAEKGGATAVETVSASEAVDESPHDTEGDEPSPTASR